MTMPCHHCQRPTRVLQSNVVGATIWRKRECTGGHRFVSEEKYMRDVADYGSRKKPDYGWMLAGDR